jgi:stage V sporulation protein SpoVS
VPDDIALDRRNIGTENRSDPAHSVAGLVDAVPVEVDAEHVDAVGAGQVDVAVAVEIGDRDAFGCLHGDA